MVPSSSLGKDIIIHLSGCHLIEATMTGNHFYGVIILGIFFSEQDYKKMKSLGLPVSVTNYHPPGYNRSHGRLLNNFQTQ